MKIIKLLKIKENLYESIIFNDDLTILCPKEIFEDLYTVNFYLQTMQKKLEFNREIYLDK